MKKQLTLIFSLLTILTASAQTDTSQIVISGRVNSAEQQAKPYVILISADGFRYDYAKKYATKNIQNLADQGVQATSMIPSFPSLTFPNHYSIVTGLYPSHHGIVNNTLYDPKRAEFYSIGNKKKVEDGSWYLGTPLWVLAEQQQMLTASFYWVGSEANIQNTYPSYYYRYSEAIPINDRIQTVVNWLKLPAERRPHLITFYFPEVDHEGHTYGPDAPQTEKAVHFVDSALQKLTEAVKTTGLPVNFIFVSDHGMTNVDTAHTISRPAAIDTAKFIVPSGDVLVSVYAKDRSAINSTYKQLQKEAVNYTPYLKENIPANFHYGVKDDVTNRIGDIVLIPKWPYIFNFSKRKPIPGRHGYDPYTVKDMHAIFYAWGPGFKTRLTIPAFQNVNVYPIVTRLLGLQYTQPIDGKADVAKQILKP